MTLVKRFEEFILKCICRWSGWAVYWCRGQKPQLSLSSPRLSSPLQSSHDIFSSSVSVPSDRTLPVYSFTQLCTHLTPLSALTESRSPCSDFLRSNPHNEPLALQAVPPLHPSHPLAFPFPHPQPRPRASPEAANAGSQPPASYPRRAASV
jgi:hypothetical protein